MERRQEIAAAIGIDLEGMTAKQLECAARMADLLSKATGSTLEKICRHMRSI